MMSISPITGDVIFGYFLEMVSIFPSIVNNQWGGTLKQREYPASSIFHLIILAPVDNSCLNQLLLRWLKRGDF